MIQMPHRRIGVFMTQSMPFGGPKSKRIAFKGRFETPEAKNFHIWSKKICGVTHLGDAAFRGWLTFGSTSKEEPLSGCPLRPTRHLEESRSFPYRTMGMSGISFLGTSKFTKYRMASPILVMRQSFTSG
jgi:hypothetical protein